MRKDISPFLIRIGLGAVVLWFSINQIYNPDKWTSLVPEFLKFINPLILIYLNGAFEAILGVLFLLGFFTRITALLFSLHLIPIMLSLGYGSAAVRDFGLFLSSLSLVFSGSGNWSLINLIKRKE